MGKTGKGRLGNEEIAELGCPLDESVRRLTREEIRELKRREADFDNPIRYAVFHSFTPDRKFIVWHDVDNDTYCSEIDHATLYKRSEHVRAVADVIAKRYTNADGKKWVYIAKLTTKNKRLRVLKYDYHE